MNETRLFSVPANVRGVQHQVLLSALLLASSSVLLLSGCGSALNFKSTGSVPSEVGAVKGKVHGGQFPVTGANVSLYEIGASGYAAALGTPLGTATTAADGTWSIPSPTACSNSSDELYLVASGGMANNLTTANSALVMTSVAGPCNGQFTTSFNIDEVTTIATEYSLSAFSSDYQHVGAGPNNRVGLTNAFATVPNLVSLSTGTALTTTPAYATPPANSNADVFSSIVPFDTINTLANILASCVNAAGGASDSACTTLFSYTGGSNSLPSGQHGVQGPTASNTADAALYIAHNPGLPAFSGFAQNNVAAVWGLPTPQAPFGPTLAAAPNDFTLALNFVGGGLGGDAATSLASGSQITIDLHGNVWIPASRAKAVVQLSPQGAPISPTTQVSGTALIAHGGYPIPYTTITSAGRIDSDQNGNIWITDTTACVFAVSQSGSQISGSPFTSACPSTGALVPTVDGSNNVWIGSTSYITSISNPSGTVRTGFPVTSGFNTLTSFLGPDESGNVWWTDGGDGNAGFVSTAGVLNTKYTGSLSGPDNYSAFGVMSNGLALWIPEPAVNTIAPQEAVSPFASGVYNTFLPPTGIAMDEIQSDGNDNFFVDSGGNSGTGLPQNVTVFTSGESQISPNSTGYTGGTPNVVFSTPLGLAIDQSGNVWVVNQNNFNAAHKTGPYGSQYLGNGVQATNVTEFVGLAGPTQPVNSLNAKNSTYGVKP